jgi:hypothetical protein
MSFHQLRILESRSTKARVRVGGGDLLMVAQLLGGVGRSVCLADLPEM